MYLIKYFINKYFGLYGIKRANCKRCIVKYKEDIITFVYNRTP